MWKHRDKVILRRADGSLKGTCDYPGKALPSTTAKAIENRAAEASCRGNLVETKIEGHKWPASHRPLAHISGRMYVNHIDTYHARG